MYKNLSKAKFKMVAYCIFIIFIFVIKNGLSVKIKEGPANPPGIPTCDYTYTVRVPKVANFCPPALMERGPDEVGPKKADYIKVNPKNFGLTSKPPPTLGGGNSVKDTLEEVISKIQDGDVKNRFQHLIPVAVHNNPKVQHVGEPDRGNPLYLKDCFEILKHGHFGSGMYYIKPELSSKPLPVYCDMATTSGGWLLLMRRKDGSERFNRTWEEYKTGFGKIDGEFWLGNDNLFILTHQNNYTLRIDFETFDGRKYFNEYNNFTIGPEIDLYRLKISKSDYFGNFRPFSLLRHNDQPFSTPDRDNSCKVKKCPKTFFASWWFDCCFDALLTGPYKSTNSTMSYHTIWYVGNDKFMDLKRVEMKIRPNYKQVIYGNYTSD